jgi:uncharacterized protein YutE (UPF0331/DUF86 family)
MTCKTSSPLNLQRAVQRSVDLAPYLIANTNARPPSTMAENFEVLKILQIISSAPSECMTKAVGFRNIAVHSYQNLDWNIVFLICCRRRHHLHDFRQFVHADAQRLNP